MIHSSKMVILLIFFAIVGLNGSGRDNLKKILNGQGLQNLTETFVAEEIEVRQLRQMSDQNLIELGVRTIGARMRLRSAATTWVQPEVIDLFLQRKFS